MPSASCAMWPRNCAGQPFRRRVHNFAHATFFRRPQPPSLSAIPTPWARQSILASSLDVPEHVIAYIDGYGNLKTILRAEVQPYAAGTNVRLRIGGREHKAIAGDGIFSVGRGQMAFAPGSSGWTNKQRRETRWM